MWSFEWWKSFFEVGGVILLFLTFAFGAGFFLTGRVVGARQEAQLRQFDRDLTAAKTELGRQQERAAKADAQVAGLERAAADAKTEMAKQQTRAATAERSLLELQNKIKGRTITVEQKNEFKALTQNETKGTVIIRGQDGDPEAILFAFALADMLSNAGWTVPQTISTPIVGFGSMGLCVTINSVEPIPTQGNPSAYLFPANSPVIHGVNLKKAFDKVGIHVLGLVVNSGPKVNENSVVLSVGHKL